VEYPKIFVALGRFFCVINNSISNSYQAKGSRKNS